MKKLNVINQNLNRVTRGRIILSFSNTVDWISFNKAGARRLAEGLLLLASPLKGKPYQMAVKAYNKKGKKR
jgi:hypothetical protein